MKTAILVDGPRQGAQVEVHDGQTQLVIPVDPERTFPSAEHVYYRVIHLNLFGRDVYVGTRKLASPDTDDLVEVLLSDEAKEALA